MFDYQRDAAHVMGMPVGPLGMNQYIIACSETREAALIDCGDDPAPFIEVAAEHGWTITKVLLTHGHFDHVMGVAATVAALNVPVHLHPADRHIYDAAPALARRYQLRVDLPGVSTVDIEDGMTLMVGKVPLQAMHVPGHCPGLTIFHAPSAALVFVGDLIFAGSIGRVDLPGADPAAMRVSLERAAQLPKETTIFSGHGPTTTLGHELKVNPFLRGMGS